MDTSTNRTPDIQAFFDPATNTVSYLASDPVARVAAVVDPVLDYNQSSGRASVRSANFILNRAAEQGLRIEWILETHAHADHLSAAPYLRSRTGAAVCIGEHITEVQALFRSVFNVDDVGDGREFDRLFRDGDIFKIGELQAEVLHTPGHTPACVSYRIGDHAFVGDTLFMPDYGTARTDFPGGDAQTLYRSIARLLTLPGHTQLYMCHDYKAPGRDHYAWQTTVAEERANNIHVRDGVTEEAFVAMRRARDSTLSTPTLLLPSIQVNIRAGQLPAPESNGMRYLKIPVSGDW
ncbi:MAG TPA: MBL fold metallo-hydrolase [Steroidobacter sp.]|nr:MBL fold metallo-hydrolase [Steroidobacter sp.]